MLRLLRCLPRPRGLRSPRPLTLVGLGLGLLGACGGGAPELPDSPARRVILITCDTLRADRLGCYGYERADGQRTSPALDALAAESVLWEEGYAHAAMTVPSLSSLMTGRLPDELGIHGNHGLFASEWPTVAELARDAGYPTGAVVSNFVLRSPKHGEGDVGVAQGFDVYDDEMESAESIREHVLERLAMDTTADAVALLDQLEADGSDRFFVWVHYQDPHGPYTPPEALAESFASPATGEEPLELAPPQKHLKNKGRGALPRYQEIDGRRDPQYYRDLYDAEIRLFDDALGVFLDQLRERGLLEDSLVLFSSDHGESLGENDYWFCHGENVQREVVRVPFLARFPFSARAGERRREPVGHVDILPTVAEALGLDAPEGVPGQSLFSAPASEDDWRRQYQVHGGPQKADRSIAVTDGRFRLVADGPRGAKPRFSLYDLQRDPQEKQNIIADQPEAFQRLRQSLAGLRGPQRPAHRPVKRITVKAEKDAMEGIGYAGEADGPDPESDDDNHSDGHE